MFSKEPLLKNRPPALFPDDHEGREKLSKLLFGAYIPEYVLLPLFYYAGKHQYFKAATAVQAGFLVGSSWFQYRVYMDHMNEDSLIKPVDSLQGKVQTIMGVPVKFLKMERWAFEFVTQMPNYIHVQQSAVVAGSALTTWSNSMQVEFARRWNLVPVVGGWIAPLGIPGVLSGLLIVSCVSHGCAAALFWSARRPDEQADAANLLFLGKALPVETRAKEVCGQGLSRMGMSFFTKAPFIWSKTTYLAVCISCMNNAQIRTGMVGIALAWYAVAPTLSSAAKSMLYAFSYDSSRDAIPMRVGHKCILFMFIIGWVMILTIALHFGGIWLCESHDLSVVHGCSSPSTEDICKNSLGNASAFV